MQEWITGFIIGICVGVGAMSATSGNGKPMGEKDKKIVIAAVAIALIFVLISVFAPKIQ